MTDKPTVLRPEHIEDRDGSVIVSFTDDAGHAYEIAFNTMDAAHFIGAFRVALEESIQNPLADSMALPGMKWVQYSESAEAVFFRIFLSDRLYHEYPVPKGTTLAAELKAFGDRVEARNLSKATHSPPESPSGKPN
jgi:hypothetical protein